MRLFGAALLSTLALGCSSARHAVRLRAAEGEVLTVSPSTPRPAVAVSEEEMRGATRSLAAAVKPEADPLRAAVEAFGVPPARVATFRFDPGRKELSPVDEEALERDPALVELTQGYLRWCEHTREPGDCLHLLGPRKVLDAYGRYAVAMAIAEGHTLDAMSESLKGMANAKAIIGTVLGGVTAYLVLWSLPEPTSKGVAAVMTVVLVGYLGVDTLYRLGRGWVELMTAADAATTFADLHEAGATFGGVMGADAARIVVMVATAALGQGAGLAQRLASMPGAVEASEVALEEGSVAVEEAPAVEAVTVGAVDLTVTLAPGALLMASAKPGKGAPPRFSERGFRAKLAKLTRKNPSNCHAHHVIPQSIEDQLQNRGIEIDINDPKYGAWWEKTDHLRRAWEYNQEWKRFLSETSSPTLDEVLAFARRLASEYGLQVYF